jgi:hypothetical protein
MRANAEQHWLPDWLAPDAALRQEMRERDDRAPSSPQSQGYYLGQVRTSIEHPLMTLEMEEIFETSRRMGLRLLQPLWDADLVDFLYRVPPDLLNRGGLSKGMVRDMLARRFPEAGFERHKKIAATGFYHSLLKREGQSTWRSTGGASVLAEQGIVDISALETASQSWFSGEQTSQMHHIWDLLNTEAWLRPRV